MINFLASIQNNIRAHNEDCIGNEDCFAEDRMRIISSNAFKRLEAKTQVFPSYHGDHYKKRLTHSLEVAEIAKSITKKLGLNQDLAEVIALSHDLGHPPFGHVGEDVLNKIMQNFQSDYKHNTFSFKIVTKIENICNNYDGLNLTIDVLDGILKHNGPINNPCKYITHYNESLPRELQFNLSKFSSLEAQIAGIADDIAYNNHDIEDGIRADILSIDEVSKLPIFGEFMLEIKEKYSFLEYGIMAKEAKYKSINLMKQDIVNQTMKNIQKLNIKNHEDVFNSKIQIVDFSPKINDDINIIRKFLYHNLYQSKKLIKSRQKANIVITKIFEAIYTNTHLMPQLWQTEYENCNSIQESSQIMCDYIAGMTDTFASSLAKQYSSKKLII